MQQELAIGLAGNLGKVALLQQGYVMKLYKYRTYF